MRNCPHCNVKVGGDRTECPLCQSPLLGEGEMEYWPKPSHLKQASVFKKIVDFILMSIATVVLVLDFMIIDGAHKHIGLLAVGLMFSVYHLVLHFIRRKTNIPRIIFQSYVVATIFICIAGWYLGFMTVAVNYIMPILCSGALLANFIFSFIDTRITEDSLVYILLNIVVGVVPYVIIFMKGKAPITWHITLIISVITFLGLVVFKGGKVFKEMQKRLHI